MYEQIIKATEDYVKKFYADDCSGHDWWHTARVRNLSLFIAKKESANKFIVEMSALLHDLIDWKLNHVKLEDVQKFLKKFEIKSTDSQHICKIISNISFKGSGVTNAIDTLEGQIVQDADRLDAIGAIGIARACAYGGCKHRELFNPNIDPQLHQTFDEYKNNQSTTINHFYEKLLLLRDKMNTRTGKKLAKKRHKYMLKFLQQFFAEWNMA